MIDHRVGLLISVLVFVLVLYITYAFKTDFILDRDYNIRTRTKREHIRYTIVVVTISFTFAILSYLVYSTY